MYQRLICYCEEVSEKELLAIASGAATVEELIRKTAASAGCGRCFRTLKILLERQSFSK